MSKQRPNRRKGLSPTAILIGVTLAVLIAFGAAFGALVLYLQRAPTAKVAEGSFLRVPLEGIISDAPQQGGIFADPSSAPATATEIAAAIRKAASDDRIRGVLLEVKAPATGWALAREIRLALVDLRASGKPCVAYGEVYTMRDYYVASACDRVVIAPSGIPLVTGQALSVTYYRDALEYLGVQPRFVHAGDYKTAVEPFERMGPSEHAVESYEFLLDGMWGTVIGEIAASRALSVEDLQRAIDGVALTPSRMVAAGLFDAAAYEDAVHAHLGAALDEDWLDKLAGEPVVASKKDRRARFTTLKEYRKDLFKGGSRKKVAVVFAEGTILSGDGAGGLFGSDGLFDGAFRTWMEEIRDDDSVVAVVLRVNSPGGSALAADQMHREIALTKAAGKPVVVSMADYAASGGYMISANADWVVAHPTTITGSIGVFGQFFDASGTYDKLKLSEHVYKRGERADLLYLTSSHDDADRAVLQQFVDDTYDSFLALVAEGRGVEIAAVAPVAQGRVWTGAQALDGRHLVDEIGDLQAALAKARELAGVDDPGYLRLPRQKSFFEALLDEMQQAGSPTVRLEIPLPGAADALRELALLQEFHRTGGVVAYLPGRPGLR
jgi:protease IV